MARECLMEGPRETGVPLDSCPLKTLAKMNSKQSGHRYHTLSAY